MTTFVVISVAQSCVAVAAFLYARRAHRRLSARVAALEPLAAYELRRRVAQDAVKYAEQISAHHEKKGDPAWSAASRLDAAMHYAQRHLEASGVVWTSSVRDDVRTLVEAALGHHNDTPSVPTNVISLSEAPK